MEFNRENTEKEFRERIVGLSGVFGPSGFEDEVAKLIKEHLKDVDYEIASDVMGNLIFHKKGKGKIKVLISAHMDEIGLIIRHIDSKGFLWVDTLGGIAPQQFFGKHVIIRTEEGRHIDGIINSLHPGRPDRCHTMPESVHEFFIEVGADSKQDVIDMGIEVGNAVSIDYPVIFLGNHRIGGKALDDRAFVFILEELVKLLDDKDNIPDFYAVFSVQEEVGARGAIVAASNIKPDIAIALDMSLATDIPGVPDAECVNALGEGASIKVMDKLGTGIGGLLSNREVVLQMKKTAKENNIPYCIEAYAAGATDASFMQTLNGGIKAGGLQTPMRYVHSYEVVDVRDVAATLELLYRYVLSLSE